MDKSERLRRPDPERTAPLRNAGTYLRDAAGAPGGFGPFDAAEGPIGHGVRLGYKVIEEQILQGQRLAQRLGRAAGKTGAAAGDLGALVERVLHLYKDVGALCFDAVEALARSPALRAGIERAASGRTADDAPSDPGAGVAIEVASTRRTQVRLDLRVPAGRFAPAVHALHAADRSIAPLTGVSFVDDSASALPVLLVEIPEAQPAATYTGVVVDSASNEPRGTLSVRVL